MKADLSVSLGVSVHRNTLSMGCTVALLLQAAYLGTAYTIMVSQVLCLTIFCLGYIYPDCKGSFRRQAVVPALLVVSLPVFFTKILAPTLPGEDLLVMSVCPFKFRLALSGVLLLQIVLAAVVQLIMIKRRSA